MLEVRAVRPRIGHIRSYDDVEAIRRFVRSTLVDDPSLVDFLRERERLVVIKPNWVQESHEYQPELWIPVITHPTLIVTLIEELVAATDAGVRIAICDAPHTYASFDAIVARGGLGRRLEALRQAHPGLSLELIDLRRETWIRKEEVVVERVPNPEDPRGYARLDLGRESLFFGHHGEGRYYGADYDSKVVNEHHRGEVQEYLLAGTPIACDLFINLPKLKTHKKTGITCCLKNLVGINGDKNWLPHHTEGAADEGGDEFPSRSAATRLEGSLKRVGRSVALNLPLVGTWAYRKMRNTGKRVLGDSEQTVRNGNWHGNDTCWRMALDLNRALLYGGLDGGWREKPKRYLAIVDGIVGGEGNGPLCPVGVDSGVLVAGDDPAVVDAIGLRLMGYDPRRFPIVAEAFAEHRWPIARAPLSAIEAVDGRADDATVALDALSPAKPGGFELHFGWTALPRGA